MRNKIKALIYLQLISVSVSLLGTMVDLKYVMVGVCLALFALHAKLYDWADRKGQESTVVPDPMMLAGHIKQLREKSLEAYSAGNVELGVFYNNLIIKLQN